MYPVIAEPPLDDGVFHVTSACPLAAAANTAVGAAGDEADCGVTEFEAAEAVPNPFELRARTLNV